MVARNLQQVHGQSLLRSRLIEMLAARELPKTLCPSEVARSLSSTELSDLGVAEWRDLMVPLRSMLWNLRDAGDVEILQKGEVLGRSVGVDDVKGPIRARKSEAGAVRLEQSLQGVDGSES